jgi:hypothetical protein
MSKVNRDVIGNAGKLVFRGKSVEKVKEVKKVV